MALRKQSAFFYNFEINNTNFNIPFKVSLVGGLKNGVIPFGFYTLDQLATAIGVAMKQVDPPNTYTVTITRTSVGLVMSNRITIATSGIFLSLLFNTGATAATSIRTITSYGAVDYTGATSYMNAATSGTYLVTDWFGNNYTPPQTFLRNIGNVNVSTNGAKEGIKWSIQGFISVEYKYESEAKVLVNWRPLIFWFIEQKPFEFIPEVNLPTVFFNVTLEKSPEDGKGLAWSMKEMVPQFPFLYTTGNFTMRLIGDQS